MDPPLWSVIGAGSASGSVVWSTPLALSPTNDILAGDFNLDGIPDIASQGVKPGDNVLTTAALSGKDGELLWSFGAEAGDCGLQSSGFALADWNGDGIDDVLQVMPNVRADSGKDGSPISKSRVTRATSCRRRSTPTRTASTSSSSTAAPSSSA